MADSKIVKAFRERLKRWGYTDIHIKALSSFTYNAVEYVSILNMYRVTAVEPCSGQRVSFVAEEIELDKKLRLGRMKKGK